MGLDALGELRVDDIKASLRKLGVPDTDANAHAMIKCVEPSASHHPTRSTLHPKAMQCGARS